MVTLRLVIAARCRKSRLTLKRRARLRANLQKSAFGLAAAAALFRRRLVFVAAGDRFDGGAEQSSESFCRPVLAAPRHVPDGAGAIALARGRTCVLVFAPGIRFAHRQPSV